MTIEIYPIHAFSDNYIWTIVDKSTSEAVVVDPGDFHAVVASLKEKQLNLKGILITHHHHDHTGGVNALVTQYNCPVYGPINSSINGITHPLAEGAEITLLQGKLILKILEVPGHTLDHIAYYNQNILFCGDTLFSGGCGRLFEGTAKQMWQSLCKLKALPADTLVFCTHEYTLANLKFAIAVEPANVNLLEHYKKVSALRENNQVTLPSSIQMELEINPFLRAAESSVKTAAETFCSKALSDNAEVFATIRRWKDQF